MLRSLSIVAVVAIVGCGGRSAIDDGGPVKLDLQCTSAEGVRLCGGPCQEPFECPGRGCTAPIAFDGTTAAVGVCWADAPSAIRPCNLCHDGEGCLERRPGEHYCVPLGACLALASAGERDVCRYPDLTPYVPKLGPAASTTCPDKPNDGAFICGGTCMLCPESCRGRSPTHPFGICGRYPEPTAICGEPFCNGSTAFVCGVFEGGDPKLARRYGHCMYQNECVASAKLMQGFHCERSDGSRVP